LIKHYDIYLILDKFFTKSEPEHEPKVREKEKTSRDSRCRESNWRDF
jgi:hypothetical protein